MGLGSQEPGPSAKPPGSPKPKGANTWRESRCASISTAIGCHSACARVGGWDHLPAECVGEGEIGLAAGLGQSVSTWGSVNLFAPSPKPAAPMSPPSRRQIAETSRR